jgi:hypothetical protein
MAGSSESDFPFDHAAIASPVRFGDYNKGKFGIILGMPIPSMVEVPMAKNDRGSMRIADFFAKRALVPGKLLLALIEGEPHSTGTHARI